ncbi:MAG: phosphoglycerate transporter [Dehalococcoidales bacterium]|nr:MAG: phosphoglycerate transporter [Dehalococcoidales bacterium]
MYQLGWFSSGRDKAARDLLTTSYNSIQQGEIEAELSFVFCSREHGETKESDLFIKLVEDYNIPFACFSYQNFKKIRSEQNPNLNGPMPQWRLDYDREVMSRLQDYNPDLCVLAGYMLVTGHELCEKYDMINLHPAAPGGPTGTWQEVIWQLIDGQAKQTGVMMHLVTPELDKGPPVTYCTFSIRGEPFDRYWQEIEDVKPDSPEKRIARENLFKIIRKHGLAREFPLIIDTLKAFGEQKFKIINHRVFDAEGKSIMGYNLTADIDKRLEGIDLSTED